MNHAPDTDTTAHRYFKNAQVAEVMQAMDRGFASVCQDRVPPEWERLSRRQQLRWEAIVDEYRRGRTPRQVYEEMSGEPWSDLPRLDQIRLEMGHLLVTGLASVQR